MAVSFAWMFGETKPDGSELALGNLLLVLVSVFLLVFSASYLLFTEVVSGNCSDF